MRISAAQRAQNENRIRAAIDRLPRGEIPPGGGCDVKTLTHAAGVDRTAFYGSRPHAHLRAGFERRVQQLQHSGQTPDPKAAQTERLKTDVSKLSNRLAQANSVIEQLTSFRAQAPAQLAAQHEEIPRLHAAADRNTNVTRLPPARPKTIGPC